MQKNNSIRFTVEYESSDQQTSLPEVADKDGH